MSRRVVLGKYGPGASDYGLRISRPGQDAADATNSALVDIDKLLFDSSSLVNSTVKIHATNTLTVPAHDGALAGEVTWTFAGTAFTNFPIVFYIYYFSGSTLQYCGAVGEYELGIYGGVLDTPSANANPSVYYMATKSDITFYNYNTSSTATVRVIIGNLDA